jgi:hypothetical protein
MEETKTETPSEKTLDRLAVRGQDAIKRLSAEMDKNPRMHEAKDRADKFGRSLLHQLNIALEDEVEELRQHVAKLEKRLAKVEKEAAARGGSA